MRFLDWLKSFRNDDIVSALSGSEVEPPFYDKDRKTRSLVWTLVTYFGFAMMLLVLSTLSPPPPEETRWDPPGLVFVMEPGPGGGGGGGDGSDEPLSLQKIEGQDQATVAVNVEPPKEDLVFDDPDIEEVEEEEEAEPEEDDAPEIKAPVVAQAPNDTNELGALEGLEGIAANAGSGTGGGIGEGDGSGLGPGTGGGFGGGAYHMGSGITPPQLRKQVRPRYTDEGLAKKVEGTVLLEVVILKEGNVGPVRVVRGLAAGLNQQAIDCVRQWAFVPAKLQGQPVDLLVEIAVQFSIL